MSILKGIMHHWNKTKNDYDVIHPETDYKKITDWNEGIVATLASTALGTLVSTLTSDSLLATMIQKVLTATGVKYNIAQNGYLCFGSLFGGIIIQWGGLTIRSGLNFGYFNYPLFFPNTAVSAVLTHMNNDHVVCHSAIYLDSKGRCALYGETSFASDTKFYIIAIGY